MYTVQKRECTVEHVYRCMVNGVPYYRYDQWTPDEGTLTEVTTERGNTVDYYSDSGVFDLVETLELKDPFDTPSALENGEDRFDAVDLVKFPLFIDPIPMKLTGRAVRVGPETVIDGIEFEQFRLDLRVEVNALVIEGSEYLYIDPETLVVVAGKTDFQVSGLFESENTVPVEILTPDEPGFLKNTAFYDCGELSQLGRTVIEARSAGDEK